MASLVSPFTIDPLQSATGFISPGFVVDSSGNLTADGDIILTTGSITSGATTLLTTSGLGSQITSSNLTSLGTLTSLTVDGPTSITGTVQINSDSSVGSLDNIIIGATTPAAGSFTVLNISGTLVFNPATEGTLDNVAVGNTIPSTGTFTTLTANSSTFNSSATFNGNASFSQDVAVTGNLNLNGTLNVGGVNLTALSLAFAAALG